MGWRAEGRTVCRAGRAGRLAVTGLVVAAQACSPTAPRPQPFPQPGPTETRAPRPAVPPGSATVPVPAIVTLRTADGSVHTLPMDDYVAGVVAGELAIGAIDPLVVSDMLAMQAILARTYAAANVGRHAREGFDLCATTHCQIYRAPGQVLPANRPLASAAAGRTSGQVLAYAGRPARALFHANCGGQTSAADRIWGGEALPYLRPVTDEACRADPTSAWTYAVARGRARDALNGTQRTAVGAHLDAITVLERDEAGRATLVALDGERSPIVRGEELRAALVRQLGDRTLRSPLFDVRRDGDRFLFTGRGWGHGAGLCQHGALARLQAGATVASVLATYFPGTTLTASLGAARDALSELDGDEHLPASRRASLVHPTTGPSRDHHASSR